MTGRISYEEFGRRFLASVVTPERVRDTIASIAGDEISTSVRLAGGVVSATGGGTVDRIDVERTCDDPIAYRVDVVATLDLEVRVGALTYRYGGRAVVPLGLAAHTHDDLTISIDVEPPDERQVTVELEPSGRGAAMIDQIGGVKDQVAREVAKMVRERATSPDATERTRIEVAHAIEAEWARMTQR